MEPVERRVQQASLELQVWLVPQANKAPQDLPARPDRTVPRDNQAQQALAVSRVRQDRKDRAERQDPLGSQGLMVIRVKQEPLDQMGI